MLEPNPPYVWPYVKSCSQLHQGQKVDKIQVKVHLNTLILLVVQGELGIIDPKIEVKSYLFSLLC